MDIKVDEAMIRMDYNITKAHICFDFTRFLFKIIKINLVKVAKDNYQYSSYLWWLMINQHHLFFEKYGLKLMLSIFIPTTTPIDIIMPSLTIKNETYYGFMDNFIVLAIIILIREKYQE